MEKRGEGEPLSHPLEPEPEPQPAPPAEKRFRLWYVGSSCLDRRTTQPMLPWLVAEIRRRGQRQEPGGAPGSGVPAREVLLLLGSPTLRCVPASPGPAAGPGRPGSPAPAVFIFEHKAQHIARFIHNSHDLTYFAYLIKAQPDNPDSPMACHVFRATDPNQASGAGGGGAARDLPAWLLSSPGGTPGAALRSRGGADVPGPGRVVPAGHCGTATPHTHPRRGGACPGPAVPPGLLPGCPSRSGGWSARGLRGKEGQCGHSPPVSMGCLASPCQAGGTYQPLRNAVPGDVEPLSSRSTLRGEASHPAAAQWQGHSLLCEQEAGFV